MDYCCYEIRASYIDCLLYVEEYAINYEGMCYGYGQNNVRDVPA